MSNIRKLVAIMFTDIVGYTKLMGIDEQKTLKLLDENNKLHQSIIERHNGMCIKEMGDGMLASFDTASDAVTAAIEIQKGVHALNEYQLRIGIHIGEVIFRDNDVLGDGVNIASRIQSITDPGAIFISEAVFQNVSNKKQIKTSYTKEVHLKNVIGSVKIYKVLINPDNNDILIKTNKSLPRNGLLFFLLFAAITVFFMEVISSVQEKKSSMKNSNIIPARAFLDVYPNPVSTILTISIGVKSKTIQRPVIKILDLNGAIMYSSEFAPIQQAFLSTIDVSRFKNAEYIVQLFDNSKYLEKTSFLKK